MVVIIAIYEIIVTNHNYKRASIVTYLSIECIILHNGIVIPINEYREIFNYKWVYISIITFILFDIKIKFLLSPICIGLCTCSSDFLCTCERIFAREVLSFTSASRIWVYIDSNFEVLDIHSIPKSLYAYFQDT